MRRCREMSEMVAEAAELQSRVVRRFCDRPGNFPAGRPYNCCESVLLTLAEYLDIDSDLIPGIGTAIGAGVSLNGLLCGSVSGVAMAIGLRYGRRSAEESPALAWRVMDDYVAAFRERFRYVNCRQLTGLNLKTEEGLNEYFARVHDYECAERLKFAVGKAAEVLRRDELTDEGKAINGR
jgi:C_GCAxxG_C_C family probable redox protein